MALRAWRRRATIVAATVATSVGLWSGVSMAAEPIVLERAVARFVDPENGDRPSGARFVLLRELVLEAWLVSYESTRTGLPPIPEERHVRIALERHVVESLLGERALESKVEAQVEATTRLAWENETVAVGGPNRLAELRQRACGRPEGSAQELAAIFRRRARAELFLQSAILDPVQIPDLELKAEHARAPDILSQQRFEVIREPLTHYVRMLRLREAASAYFQATRTKLHLEVFGTGATNQGPAE